MSQPFGSDLLTFVGGTADLDPRFVLSGDKRIVAEACARRLMTPRGGLVGAPDYGFDLREFLGARITNVTRARIVAGIEEECRKEERVERARVVSVQLPTSADTSLRLKVAIVSTIGAFDLVLTVDRLSVEVLTNG